jgi:2'-5' RNA ligase
LVLMRLFLAFAPSGPESRAIYNACERLENAQEAPLRWVPADNWHVTATFLGEVADHLLTTLAELVEPLVASCGQVSLKLDQLAWFPDIAKARLLALMGEPDPVLRQLQQTLAGELRRQGFSIQQRAWRPHLTLARYRGARKRFTPFLLPHVPAVDLRLERLSLFQSVAGSAGAGPRYLPLQHFGLSP